jgi:uncharacterized phage-like protein YoqJ
MIIENKKYSIFHIEGGLGKHVAATAVARAIKKNHPERDLIVVCAYPEIFINLDFISRVYRHGNAPYFYQDYIKGQDFLMFKHEPYFTTEHLKKEKSLVESWSNLYNLQYSGELPEIVFNYRQRQYNNKLWTRNKPIFLIQTNGGPLENQPYPYSWTRDIPPHLHLPIVNAFRKTHHIIQVCRDESQSISDVEVISKPLSNMELFGLVEQSDKRLLIDSSLQHAAMALNKPSTVLWVGTNPQVFGYDYHKNIVADLGDENYKLPDSYLFDYNFLGTLHECPVVDPTTMFDVEQIINTLNSGGNLI